MRSNDFLPKTGGYIFSPGIMAEAIRKFDWSSTPLGPLAEWPPSLRLAVDLMLGCAFPTTLQWGPELLLLYNDAYIPLIGDRHPAALGRPILDSFPEIVPIYEPMAKRVLAGERILLEDQCYRYSRQGDPENLWFDLSYSPVRDENGEVRGVFAVGLNITSRVLAEEARSDAEARLRRVLETDAVGVIFFDHSGTVVDANDVFLRMLGYTKADISSKTLTWRSLTPPEWVAASEEQMEKLAATGRTGPYEKQYILKDGTKRWMLFAGRDLGDGTVAEYCIDLTAQRAAEEAKQSIEQRFRAFVQATSDSLYRMSPDWKEMRQLQGQDFLTDTEEPDRDWLSKYIHPEDQTQVWGAVQEAIRTQSKFELEHRVLQANGEFGWICSRAIPLRNEQQQVLEWFGVATNITDRKRAEQALITNEKLATLGRLAATIAHEINNPLEAMTNLLYLIQTSDGLAEPTRHFALAADAELKRIAHITRLSLGFYREASEPAPTSITELLDDCVDLLRAKTKAKHAQIHHSWTERYVIPAISGELRQVFSNLLANALDAIEPGGNICIRVRNQRSSISSSRRSIRVTIADDGKGIPLGVRTNIFDPLFSTKGTLGTGLGLWVTNQLVAKHKGTIHMRSRSEGARTGTAFVVVLPEVL